MEKQNKEPKPLSAAEQEVLKSHGIFWQGCALRDVDMRFSVCSDVATFFGTGLHERAVGKQQAREMNEKGIRQFPDPFEINTIWETVRVVGDIAWVEANTAWIRNVKGKSVKDIIRLTTIFKKEQGRWMVIHMHGSEPDYRLQDGEFMVNENIIDRNRVLEKQVFERTQELELEKQRSDKLLLNILPEKVAEELKTNGKAVAKLYSQVTVLFTDFKDFTLFSQQLSPQELIDELHECFREFDRILWKYNIEKIKTIGDGYLAVSGLPASNENHAADVVRFAIDVRDFIDERKKKLGKRSLQIRIGIHSGEVIAGIVGIKKFAYDIWGDTVNTAARMQQNCQPGKVNISGSTYAMVKDKFHCQYRGEIEAKNKGKMKMYFAEYKDK
jgi:class 3 adenylate cyclase/ketosteroid isomerase-like protein